jgi:hypothetical protein
MKNLELYENFGRERITTLTSRRGKDIIITLLGARIQSIDNQSGVNFPFSVGQSYTQSIETWACNNGFTIDGKSPCPEEKIFGIRKKDIPQGHELRFLFPHKFRD